MGGQRGSTLDRCPAYEGSDVVGTIFHQDVLRLSRGLCDRSENKVGKESYQVARFTFLGKMQFYVTSIWVVAQNVVTVRSNSTPFRNVYRLTPMKR